MMCRHFLAAASRVSVKKFDSYHQPESAAPRV